MTHLTNLGHRRIAFIGGRLNTRFSDARITMYRQEMTRLGVPPEEQYDVIRTFLEQSGPAYRQDLAALLHVGDRQCALILKHMVEDGRLVQAGQRYALPIREEVLL